MQIDDKLFRSIYIWKELDKIRENKNVSYSKLSSDMWLKSYQPISNPLQWKIIWSDKLFKRIAEALWIWDKEVNEIFKNADLELTRRKYPEEFEEKKDNNEEIQNFLKMTREEQRQYFLNQMALSVKWVNKEAFIKDLDTTIDFFINKYK